MNGNPGRPRDAGQRRRKFDPNKTKLRNSPYWIPLLRSLSEPLVIPAVIEGRDLVIRNCPICGKRHTHGYTDEEVGSLSPRMSHCVPSNGVSIMLRVLAHSAEEHSDA